MNHLEIKIMLKSNKQILEGSRAIALVVKNIAPAVISAYPITPQTHIVEDLANFKANGQANYEYVRAESEFAAASIVLGASATGVRSYSATSSQGLLLMTEVIYNISGLRLPVVMTCANRAISSPINIWNDHSDVMSIRDAGWIQLFASNNQEVVNQHILAFRLAELLKLPVMINIDGFILTHSYESVLIPDQKTIKKFLPDYIPEINTYLNTDNPITMGGFFTPDHYMETRQSLHNDLINSLSIIKKEYKSLQKILNLKNKARIDNGLIEYNGPKNPQTILIAMGSVIGTISEVLKNYPEVGLLKIKVYRPFPSAEIKNILANAKKIAVIEKAISLGQAGPLYTDLKAGLEKKYNLKNYIVGLGGRDITSKMIKQIIKDAPKKNNYLQFIGKI